MAAESGGSEETVQSQLNASLKQFIASLEPALKETGSIGAAEDYLTHLEATDENFHRYEFVRQIRNHINTVLLPVVANEIEKRAVSGVDCHNAIPLIIEELLASQEYATLSHSILENVKSTVNEMIQSFDESSKQQTWTDGYSEYCGKYFSVDAIEEESSLSSSGKMSYMFMPHEKIRNIVQKLDMSQSVETRYQALVMLSQIPQSDVVTSEHWGTLKKSLSLALGDEDDKISDISLKLVSKIHIMNNGHATREVFTCLTHHLMDVCQESQHAQLDDGLNVANKNNQTILKKFRLLCEFLHEIPSYWVRYPERDKIVIFGKSEGEVIIGKH